MTFRILPVLALAGCFTGGPRLTTTVRHLQTGDGSVALALPHDLGAHIDASTRDGHVRSTIPLSGLHSSRAEGDINGGGPPIVVRTDDGSIQLTEL